MINLQVRWIPTLTSTILQTGFDDILEENGEGKLTGRVLLSLLSGPTKRIANSHLHGQSPKTPPHPCPNELYPFKPELK